MTIQLSPLLKGLVLHAPLDQESYNPATKRFTDHSAYSNHGTSHNAASFVADRMGQADRAMDFNGSSDCVNCGNGESLDITDEVTMSIWVKTSGTTGARSRILSKGEFKVDGYEFIVGESEVVFRTYESGDYHESIVTLTNPTQWNHIIITKNGVNGKIYINNILEDDSNTHINPTPSTDPLLIGRYLYTVVNYFNGSIDDVRIYNRVLTDTERTLLYESYRPRLII